MDRVKVVACGYRDWALEIFAWLARGDDIDMTIITNPRDATLQVFEALNPFIILFYGWSWMVKKEVLDKYLCICLHPSPLPLYRGGSPFQHQILSGETESAASFFRMAEEMDVGDLCAQVRFSLEGDLDDIFERLISIGVEETLEIINKLQEGTLQFWPQVGEPSTYRRRKPAESEISGFDFQVQSAESLYNKIRALQDPYPNAYVVCGDGERLYLTGAHL